jgi:hypothetical protein
MSNGWVFNSLGSPGWVVNLSSPDIADGLREASLPEQPTRRLSSLQDAEVGLWQEGIRINWRDYYHEFCRLHGEPVIVDFPDGPRQLFADGWTYAMRYRGPEWPPPSDSDELTRLQVTFLTVKIAVLEDEGGRLSDLISRLARLQEGCSIKLPFQHSSRSRGSRTAGVVMAPEDRLGELQDKLAWLNEDLMACRVELDNLKEQP